MLIADVLKALKLDGIHESWSRDWETTQKTYPGAVLYFLEDDFIDEANLILKLPHDAIEPCHRAAGIVREREELSRLAWHAREILFSDSGYEQSDIWQNWPSLKASMGDMEGMFAVLVFVSELPAVSRYYEKKGISQKILIDTLNDVDIWMRDYYHLHGVWGLDELCWSIHHFHSRIFRLGRLQFMPGPFTGNIKVYRNKKNNEVVALMEGGIKIRDDGRFDGNNSMEGSHSYWFSFMDEKNGFVTANPVRPDGIVSRKLVSVSLSEWELVLQKGDPVLGIHIPRGGRMPYEMCIESINTACDFFHNHFPEQPFNGFTLGTWFLDPQLKKMLPASSNIVRFQKEFYLYRHSDSDGLLRRFVFNGFAPDSPDAPKESSLQQAILDYVAKGNHMYTCSGFILNDDMDYFGADFYQSVLSNIS